jgi:4-hydroxybenzoate polyprenyltransferase
MERALTSVDAARLTSPQPRSIVTLLRVGQWAHFVFLPLATLELHADAFTASLAVLRGVAIAALVLGYGYLENAAADREMDRSERKNPLRPGALPGWVGATKLGLVAAAMALSLAGPALVTLATLTSLAAGWVYSAGPRLKKRPYVGTLLNAVAFGPLVLVGASSSGLPERTWSLMALFSLLLLQNQLVHEAADATEDRLGGVRTTFVSLGRAGSGGLTMLLGLLAAAVVWPRLGPAGALPIALTFGVGAPAMLLACGDQPATMARARLVHRFAALAAGATLFAAELWR